MAENFENYSLFNFITSDKNVDYEPKHKSRFILYIPEVPQSPIKTSEINTILQQRDNLMISLLSVDRPHYNSQPYEIKHYNETISLPGKTSHSRDLNCEFVDYIDKNFNPIINNSTTTILYRWYNLVYNVDYGVIGYKDELTINSDLYLLDPHGDPVEQWRYYNMWPYDIDFNNLKYGTNEECNINVIFRYDKAKLLWADSSIDINNGSKSYKNEFEPII